MKCPYCRAENGPNSSFCSNCGNPIHSENYETSGINQPGEYETSGVNKSGDYETSGVNQRGDYETSGVNQRGDYETSGVNQRGDYETSGVNQRRGYETSGVDRRGGYETSDARNTRRDGPYDPYDPYDPYVTNLDDGDYPTEEPGDVVTVIPNGGSGNILKIITIILSIIASVSVFLFALKFTGLADKIGLSSFLPFLEQDTQDIDSEEDEPKTDPKDTPIPTSSPIPTATPEPTATPIPTPTPEPTPTPVSYPADQIQGVVQRGEVDLQNMHRLNTYNADATSVIYQYGLPSDYNKASCAFDDNIGTNWQEGVSGAGQGEVLFCQLESGYTVSYIQLRLGNWNPDQSTYNYYNACNRPSEIIIKLDNYQQSFTFPDSKEVFTICLNHPFEASNFSLILGNVYGGYEWSDTAITDIMFYGNPK